MKRRAPIESDNENEHNVKKSLDLAKSVKQIT